jgi:carboxymethylenebutenolidase
VPNLFYRHGAAPLIEDLPDLLKPENRPKMMAALMPYIRSLTPDAAMRDAEAYLAYLAVADGVTPGAVCLVGYCMGGAIALRTSATYPDRVAAVATLHAGNLASDAPDSPHRLVPRIQAELYLAHADQDQSMPLEQIERLEVALDDAGVRYRSQLYDGARHGFTMSDTAAYDEEATERHWTELLGLFDRTTQAT